MVDSVAEIRPLERYEPSRARSSASVRWLLSRAFGSSDDVPADLRESVPGDQDGDAVGVALERLLLSCELYSRAYQSLLQRHTHSHTHSHTHTHRDLLQLLQQHSVPPTHTHTHTPVTDTELTSKPINMGAHLALIDSLMSLAAMETVGMVKMAKEAEQFGDGASWENSLLFWINKLIQKLRESTESEDGQKTQRSTDLQPLQPSCPSRWYWKLVPHAIAFCLKESGKKPPVIRYRKDKVRSKQTPTFTVVSGVKDLSNGCAIAATIHFYCPQILPLEEVCLKDTMSVADSLYNLQLIREFCNDHLHGCCPLVLEDLLYAPPILRVNIMCFLAELLAVFEVQKPDIIKPVHTLDLTDASGLEDCTSPISGNSGSPFLLKQPFLSLSSPVSSGGGTEGRGWSKKQISRPLSAVAFSIPFPLDSDVDVVMGNPLFRSVSTDSLTMATNPTLYSPPEDLSKLIGQAPLGELPAIEEALQVIHSVQNEPRQRPEGAPAGFFLHSPDNDKTRLSSSAPCRSGMMYRPIGGEGISARRPTGCSRDSDTSEDPGTPTNGPRGGQMTSFAERRKRLPESPGTSRVLGSEEPSSPGMMSPAGTAEAQELGAQLEEKRKAIEAQKRRIEAIFTKHRQRLGKSAFLQLQRAQGEGGNVKEEADSLSLDERLTRMEEALQKEEEQEKEEEKRKKDKKKEEEMEEKDGEQDVKAPPKLEKQVTFSVEPKKVPEKEPPLVEYNEAVSKLTTALQALQKDMQRLTEQQQKLMGKKTSAPSSSKSTPSKTTPSPSKAWAIPASPKISATPPRLSRESTRDLSPSGSPSRQSDLKSPKTSKTSTRKVYNNSPPPKSPKRQHSSRPCDLSFQPLTRVLSPLQNVDTLPHLRRVSPSQCQVQTNSSLRIGGPRTPQEPDTQLQPQSAQESAESESGSSDEHTPLFNLELEPTDPAPPPAVECAVSTCGGSSSGAPSECSFLSDVLISASQRQEEGETDQEQLDIFSSDSMSDHTETESRAGVSFYFKEEGLSEEEMALKRALLLERQQRRAEELKRRRERQEQENPSHLLSTDSLLPSGTPPLSQSLPTTYAPPLPPQTAQAPRTPQATPPGTPQRRGGFTKAEYERRQQLKIMADLERVLKQKPAQRSNKKQHTHSPRKEKKEQQNFVQPNGPLPPDKPTSTSDSVSKLMSPGRLANQNGEKDWENGSNASSPASVTEYTGPKLFKEPSFKSNKFIIHNALSRCCLAGKVNESQKNKIVEEMEKSSANHFLILLRDSNCQFRAVYTLDGQSDEMQRLCGVGPRAIPCSSVEAIYKYNSDRKQFSALPSRTVSMSVDAFTIPAHLWQTKKQSTPKKTATPK
ncbi:calmodulin-regulated spectrin-associated protein 3 isoform X2 [Pangasianodon hypophthalmus]|uniref:calmodulin-regulated spectrin-associated protein 3 isoform X2 n=1 Tax=Pangasianodon hypophthalmus TaxID=310915 RepID=UPI000EFF7CC9|nr:calmodulin-regulated spectrin-associated protein 3 isoform X2 [Pangasianodon hypophthalmus]